MSSTSGYGVDLDSLKLAVEENLHEEEMDVPEIVEEMIELLLSGLRDTVS